MWISVWNVDQRTRETGPGHTITDSQSYRQQREKTYILEVPVEVFMLMLMFMFIGDARIFDLSAKMEEAFCRGWRRVAVVMSLI
jgi:hypothetical protein